MSMLLFLSRIYDKEAPFITCKSLSGEVHSTEFKIKILVI